VLARLTRGRPLHASEEGARRTEFVPMTDGNGLLAVARPPFAAIDICWDGWMLDLDIEYRLDEPRHTGQTDSWHLPRCAQLGHLFASNRVHARVNTHGQPSVSVVRTERAIALTVPAKWRLLDELLSIKPSAEQCRGAHLETRCRHARRCRQDVAAGDDPAD
jgi:hypothetical protein